jgi:hypothetical protein
MARNETIRHLASYHGREPLSYIVAIDGVPLRLYDATDLADYDVTYASFVTDSTNGTPIITETATGIAIEPTKEVAYDAVTDKIRWDRHGLEKDTMVQYDNSGGTVMGSLVDGRYYYLRDVTDNYFNLCYEKGGDPVALSAGSGTHTILVVGQVIYTPQSDSCYPSIATHYACFFVVNGGTEEFARSRFPESFNQNAGGMIEVRVK